MPAARIQKTTRRNFARAVAAAALACLGAAARAQGLNSVVRFHAGDAVFCALALAAAIALGLAAQGVARELIAGLILRAGKSLRPGHEVEIAGRRGTVQRVGLLSIRLRGANHETIKLPNSAAAGPVTILWTPEDEKTGCAVRVRVAQGSPVEVTLRLLAQAAGETPGVYQEPGPVVALKDFGEGALVFDIRYTIGVGDLPTAELLAGLMRVTIERLLRREGIELASPVEDVYLHADKGLNVTVKQERGRML